MSEAGLRRVTESVNGAREQSTRFYTYLSQGKSTCRALKIRKVISRMIPEQTDGGDNASRDIASIPDDAA